MNQHPKLVMYLQRAFETGLVQYLTRKYQPMRSVMDTQEVSSSAAFRVSDDEGLTEEGRKINLEQIMVTGWITVGGWALSALVFTLELLRSQRARTRKTF